MERDGMKMDRKLRVGVIFGGRSGEHEVSLMSARSVLSAFAAEKYEVVQIGITYAGEWLVSRPGASLDALSAMEGGQTAELVTGVILPDPSQRGLFRIKPGNAGAQLEWLGELDVVFPVLHGSFGEDGTLQGLLEMAGVAYVGAGVLGSSVGMDKVLFKDVMITHQIPVLPYLVVLRSEIEKGLQEVITRIEQLGAYPLFVKPANLGSSVGISKCRNRSDLLEGLMDACRFDRRVLVEKGINPREIEVSVLGNDAPEASVPGEVIPSRDFYSYEAKYLDGSSELIIPAKLPGETAAQARELAVKAYRAIDCAGMARVDFLLDRDSGKLYLGEINTIPGFTKISMYPILWEASGMAYPALVDRLLELALERKADNDRTLRKYR
jgi:D-alanine-D-alanine ligase